MPLSLKQKKSVLKKIRKTSTDSIYTPLKQLIKKGVKLPVIGNTSPLKEFIAAYEAAKHFDASQDQESYAELQLNMIKRYLKDMGCRQLMEALRSDSMDPESLSDEFLEHFSTHFEWPLTEEPSVKLTIVQGKVYWRIVQSDDILYDNAVAKGNDSDEFFVDGETVTITMSWANFRRFKDAGKRTSSVEITKERFRDECKKIIPGIKEKIRKEPLNQPSVVGAIWNELKEMLDHNNRLSHAWYSYSGRLYLDSVSNEIEKYTKASEFLHTYTAQALKNASINPDYHKILPGNFEIFRPARTVIDWKSTGRRNYTEKSESNHVQQWDVGSKQELNAYAVSGDQLEHDHIPSQVWMKEDIRQQYSNHDIDAEQKNEEETRSDYWGCIEAKTEWHNEGPTHKKSQAVQLSMEKPFYEEFNYYLNKAIGENPSPQYLIEVIGAFRYLFSCHIKEKFTTYSYGFFANRPELVHDIDTLLLDKLSQVSAEL